MIMHEIIDRFHSLDGLLHIAPEPDSPYPELVWGDHFFYFAPDGEVPANTQPFATITTKDYPDDTASRPSAPDRWSLNPPIGAPDSPNSSTNPVRHRGGHLGSPVRRRHNPPPPALQQAGVDCRGESGREH